MLKGVFLVNILQESQLLMAQAPAIDEAGFKPMPAWFLIVCASVMALVILRKLAPRFTPDGHPVLDKVVDFSTLGAVLAIPAATAGLPLVKSFIDIIVSWANAGAAQQWSVFGINITGTIIVILALLLLGWWYEKNEDMPTLIAFGLTAQAAAVFIPWINVVLAWWINNPVQFVWNEGLVDGLNAISNSSFSFS